ncbi:putative quinol monooxygenase [Shewanella gaetbuli]|uniref:Antibiotic biosynthesis monooxygenase n=1 Tax=Shewanella gaetbuli TaxID=220752 RepID=A0A9X1ZTD5_9GAMM|nr:antibiotic biosynthesis monooxygenase [Shewanella gaetbuli]MCL1143728.1 antibiotic biosynthesis monooxygenase [Shewanella gaetbuli]
MSDFSINSTQLVCVAQFVAKPGKRDALVAALAALIPDTRREHGCIRYELNVSLEDENKVAFVEKFVSKAAFDEHCSKAAIQDYFHNVMPELVASHHVEVFSEVIA